MNEQFDLQPSSLKYFPNILPIKELLVWISNASKMAHTCCVYSWNI